MPTGRRLSAEHVGEGVQGAGDEGEVGPHAALVAGQQAGVDEHLQVVRHGGLGQAERFGEVADAGLAAVVGGDHRQQPQPGRVGDRLQRPGEICCAGGGQRLADQRGTARDIGQRQRRGTGHEPSMPDVLTDVDVCVTMARTLMFVYVKGLAMTSSDQEIREHVRDRYAAAALAVVSGSAASCCGPSEGAQTSCCGPSDALTRDQRHRGGRHLRRRPVHPGGDRRPARGGGAGLPGLRQPPRGGRAPGGGTGPGPGFRRRYRRAAVGAAGRRRPGSPTGWT